MPNDKTYTSHWYDVEISNKQLLLVGFDWISRASSELGDITNEHLYKQMCYIVFKRILFVEQLRDNATLPK